MNIHKEVLDHVEAGVEYFTAVRDADNQLVDFKLEYYNRAAVPFVPIANISDAEGTTLKTKFPPVAVAYFDNYVQVVEEDIIFESEEFHDKSKQWYHVVAKKLGDGLLLSFTDVTGRKDIEQELNNSNSELQTLLNHNPAFIVRLDEHLRYLYVNKAVLDRIGLRYSQMHQQNIKKFYPISEIDAFVEGVADVFKEKAQQVRFTSITRDNQVIYYQTLMLPEFDDDGRVVSVLNITRDITDLKNAEINLKQTKEKFEMIFNNAFQFMVLLNKEGKILEVNQTALAASGYNSDDLFGKFFWEPKWWFYRRDDEFLKQVLHKVSRGEFYRDEIEIKVLGRHMILDFSLKPVTDKEGNIQYIIAEGRDIKELIDTRKQLHETSNFLQTLVAHIPDGIARLNSNDEVIYLNKNCAERWHLDPDKYHGISFYDIQIPEQKKALFEQNLRKVKESKRTESFMTAIDGNYTYVALSPEFNAEGEVVSVLSVSRDITELRQNQNALEKINKELTHTNEMLIKAQNDQQKLFDQLIASEKQTRTLVQHSPNVIIRLSPDLKYKFVNDSLTQYTDLSILTFEGVDILAMSWPKGAVNDFEELLLAAKQGDKQRVIEFQVGERVIHGMFNAVPEYDIKGKLESILVIMTDLTEQKEFENQLILQKEKLEEVNADLEAFTYTVSHDLRTPIRGILGHSEKLKGENLNEDMERSLAAVQKNAKKMEVLIDELLAFSRIGRSEIYKASIDIKDVFNESLSELSHQHEFNYEIASNMPIIRADKHMLKQVVINLCDNAVKYSKKVESPKIKVSYFTDDHGHIVYCIEDNGIGFEQKYGDKIFEVFHRLHTETEYPGVGVGLAIVKQIINKHNGEIWAKSEPGNGTTVFFKIPDKK
ncbi:PAS domain-containing protein [Fulvivirga ligni]|uniref:PAS domain-containing protein n=1 Tax=Fulvivirga ligni TaxID=2904246 RepID=UPI001F4151A0|nr:PAS domain-containing protein [Fulvivirga ligni]UII23058.1 PAS domain-containing protein [Fulvivirga ligni]